MSLRDMEKMIEQTVEERGKKLTEYTDRKANDRVELEKKNRKMSHFPSCCNLKSKKYLKKMRYGTDRPKQTMLIQIRCLRIKD